MKNKIKKLIIKNYKQNDLFRALVLKRLIASRNNKCLPISIWIEPTNHCNISCIYCVNEGIEEKGYMDPATIKKIVDQLNVGEKRALIGLQGIGESLLHKDISRIVESIFNKKIAKIIHLSTNGTVLKDDTENLNMLEQIDDLRISIDAIGPDTYKNVKKADHYLKVVNNIEKIINMRSRGLLKNMILRVKLTKTEHNKNDAKAFGKQWNKADIIEVDDTFNWGGQEDRKQEDSGRYACPKPWYSLFIKWNGDISFCCLDYLKDSRLGNIHEDRIEKIWQSAKVKEVREKQLQHRFDELEICRNCTAWEKEPNIEACLRKNQKD
ncbi:radical SAM/SPASM domain-containing protein [Candidatus Margulisiibacteriota bacterium]